MPRYKEPFSLYPRKIKEKKVWYFRTYDAFGQRTSGKSTGETSKTKARLYCIELLKSNNLYTPKELTLTMYSRDWWIWEKCKYIKFKLSRSPKDKPSISKKYANTCKSSLDRHILPYLGKYKLSQLSPRIIEQWLFKLKDDLNLSAKTVNLTLSVLKVMIAEAVRLDYINTNPLVTIMPFVVEQNDRGILTIEKVKLLLAQENIEDLWDANLLHYTINLLAACTGMRQGEIRALSNKDIHPGYILVQHSYGEHGIKSTKTNKERAIPLPIIAEKYLNQIKPDNGFIFSSNNGKSPINKSLMNINLYKAMEKIGITEEIRKQRKIVFHSWRHWFNTYLRSIQISDAKIQHFTGHSTMSMTDNYTKFQPDQFKEVTSAVDDLLR